MIKIHKNLWKNKKVVAVALAAAMSVTAFQPSFASKKTEAQNAKKQAQNQLESVTEDISSITSQQKSLQKEIDALDAELVELLVNMDILSEELEEQEQAIEQANKDLKLAKKEEQTQYERMKKRIRYMYERGDDSIIEALLGATSMSDLLNRIKYCSQVYDYDREQLEAYKEVKQEVTDLRRQLLEEQSQMEEMQENYESQEQELNAMVAQKQSTMDDFDSQLSRAKELAAAYKETIQEQNRIIREEEQREAEEAAAAEAARIEAERAAAEAAAAAQAAREAAAAQAAREAAAQAARAAAARSSAASSDSSASSSNTTTAQSDNSSAASSGSSAEASSDSAAADESSSSGSSQSSAPAVSASGATGSDVIAYATQFIGNPYVWGGTSLTNGADCSGFVMSVYAHFGYSLPHSSAAMAGCGIGVSYSEAQPGDLICYSGHVALYMGNGRIVGAQSSATGITTQTATYRTIIAVRRIIY